jgi:hypothetical protein
MENDKKGIPGKLFLQALQDNGLENGVINFDPPTAGKAIKRYRELMTSAGYCPMCEQLLNNCICEVNK